MAGSTSRHSSAPERADRLKAALKANLARRKAQARARTDEAAATKAEDAAKTGAKEQD